MTHRVRCLIRSIATLSATDVWCTTQRFATKVCGRYLTGECATGLRNGRSYSDSNDSTRSDRYGSCVRCAFKVSKTSGRRGFGSTGCLTFSSRTSS